MFQIFYILLSMTLFILQAAEATSLHNISDGHQIRKRQASVAGCTTQCNSYYSAYASCGVTANCICGADMVNALVACVDCGVSQSTNQDDITSVEQSLSTYQAACAELGYSVSISITAQPTASFACSIGVASTSSAGAATTNLGGLFSSLTL